VENIERKMNADDRSAAASDITDERATTYTDSFGTIYRHLRFDSRCACLTMRANGFSVPSYQPIGAAPPYVTPALFQASKIGLSEVFAEASNWVEVPNSRGLP
jgi:hypothetical protein